MKRCGVFVAVGLAIALCMPYGPATARDDAKPDVKAGVKAKAETARPAAAGSALTWQEAMGRVGEQVVVEGTVVSVRIRKDKAPHLLCFGTNRQESLSVAIFDKKKFGNLQAEYQGKKIRVNGKVSIYRNAAQIKVTDLAQITILE